MNRAPEAGNRTLPRHCAPIMAVTLRRGTWVLTMTVNRHSMRCCDEEDDACPSEGVQRPVERRITR